MVDVDADALKDLVRRANFLPYLSYGSPHDLSILEKISGYYIARSHALILLSAPRRLARVADRLRLSGI
jgi:hypothetical protein